ncbi:hypothetical protein FRX31_017085 [Thalictrum thalictroides]|uniref:Uncharacterized protein n=1 Tax=Thalictrum thalictroides TaxID=46969 RepID=A0A7J6W928_THATH|nr:hypothetical protein FRX31_017085 [Thalictrum thalictroides]
MAEEGQILGVKDEVAATNVGRKKRKLESKAPQVNPEENGYGKSRGTKGVDVSSTKDLSNLVFNGVVPQVVKTKREIKVLIWYWCNNWVGRNRFHFRALAANWEGVLAGTVMGEQLVTGID